MLVTEPVPRLVPEDVFDAFGWCGSDTLEWRCPAGAWDPATALDGSDPARMVFVFQAGAPPRALDLPRELARLHAPGLGLTDEWALAPYAIDDATDGLHAGAVRPREAFWLAADNLNALFWGLHDWAHFHNHGPFDTEARRALNELQCDLTALVWLQRNRHLIRGTDEHLARIHDEVITLAAGRLTQVDPLGPANTSSGMLTEALDLLRQSRFL